MKIHLDGDRVKAVSGTRLPFNICWYNRLLKRESPAQLLGPQSITPDKWSLHGKKAPRRPVILLPGGPEPRNQGLHLTGR